ncbi:MAG: glutaredoxin 3 [Betaproteobacteria bacterium HGW-Betaproteobacteria-9]|nr:MAG: glutaredoxin 3 [Betaproteobacteria bacterium HGW-Betaproteobacteria-9]
MALITFYSAQGCGYCSAAENLLRRKGFTQWHKIAVDHEPDMLEKMIELTGRRTVPQIFVGAVHIGGFDDLVALDRAGKLDGLLSACQCKRSQD